LADVITSDLCIEQHNKAHSRTSCKIANCKWEKKRHKWSIIIHT